MAIAFYFISFLLILVNVLSFVPHQHWVFRVWEFGRLQLMVLHFLTLLLGVLFIEQFSIYFWIVLLGHSAFFIYNGYVLLPYTSLVKKQSVSKSSKHSKSITLISVNVYQFNNRYQELISLVKEVSPDILFTMESNQDWENALKVIENEYSTYKKVALENTYGIHFFTKLEAKTIKVNYFVADDVPSIEAVLVGKGGVEFTFFGVHPPPPSPTEENNSRERDGELLCVGKRVKQTQGPVIVVGDFNNVAWAKSSVLFRKTSELIDPRIGRGFVSTYHAKYQLLRFPIDLFYHSKDVFIEKFKTLRYIGSDHLPLFCEFFINLKDDAQINQTEKLAHDEIDEVNEMIHDGIAEQSNRPEVAIKDEK